MPLLPRLLRQPGRVGHADDAHPTRPAVLIGPVLFHFPTQNPVANDDLLRAQKSARRIFTNLSTRRPLGESDI